MASLPVPICLQFITDTTQEGSAAYDGTTVNGANRYYVDLSLLFVQAFNTNDAIPLAYNSLDIKVGGWLAGTSGGFAWRITEIGTNDGTNVTVQLEDEENYNYAMDPIQSGGAPLFNRAHIYFELGPDGLPIFSPLYGQYLDNTLPQLPYDIICRFLSRNQGNQYVPVFQANHGFLGGETIWIDPADGKYKRANNTNAQYAVGLVSSIDIPDNRWFTYKSYGTFYGNIMKFFNNVDLSSYDKGSFLYISTDGINQYTTTPPTDIVVPAWVYLGLDSYGNQQGILYTVPSLYSGSTGTTGPTGTKGESGDLFYSATVGNWVSNPVVVGGYETLAFSPGLSYIPGNSVVIVSTSDPNIYFQGRLMAYNKINGNTEVYVTSISGGPSFPRDVYYININPLDGTEGPAGFGDTGATGPTGVTGPPGDIYYSSTVNTWAWSPVNVGGSVTLYVEGGLSYLTGHSLLISSRTPGNTIQGTVLSYNKLSGILYVRIRGYSGSSTFPEDIYDVNLNPIDGPQGATGVTGPLGPAGSQGATGPTGTSGDLFYSITNGQWSSSYVSTGVYISMTFSPNLSYIPGNSVIVTSQSDPEHFFQGRVVSYDSIIGNMEIYITSVYGDTNFARDYYLINLNPLDGVEGPQGVQGLQGPTGPQGITGATGKSGDIFYTHTTSLWSLSPVEIGGETTLVVESGLSYIPGHSILISSRTPGYTIQATVTGYDKETGYVYIIIRRFEGGDNFPPDIYDLNLNPLDGIQGPAGSQGDTGATGPQGIMGATGNSGDIFYTHTTSLWSLSPVEIGGETTLVVESGLSYIPGHSILISSRTPGYTIQATVTVYDKETGYIYIIIRRFEGGDNFPPDTYDVNLNPIDGIQGPTGTKGDTGLQGATGPTGLQGATGTTGAQGDTGLQGQTGSQGETGPTGMSGDLYTSQTISNWMSDPVTVGGSETLTISAGLSFTPGNSVVVVANSDTTHLFQGQVLTYNTSSGAIEISITSVQGSATFPSDIYTVNLNPLDGIQGPAGVQGDTGLQGATGQTGPTGQQGVMGMTGPEGETGPQGETGPTGNTGLQGATGLQGDTGSQGYTGPTGVQGITGPTGAGFLTTSTELWGWGPVAPGYTGIIRIAPGLAYVSGSSIIISSPTTMSHYIKATVSDYNILTGDINFIVISFTGSNIFDPELYKVALNGLDGAPGPTGAIGITGPAGATGLAGQGVPTGGNTGDILVKTSATNYDASWQQIFDMVPLAPYFSGGSPTDIQSAILRMATLLQTLNSGNPIP
jgi:collagen type VII alpha